MFTKKKIALFVSILLVGSMLAMMISAAPIVQNLSSAKINAKEAENIALEYVGLTRENVRFERTEIDYERGKLVWEVEFEKGNTEYSFEIDAKTGKILREEIDEDKKPSQQTTKAPVTETPATEPPAEKPAKPETTEAPTPTEISRDRAIEIALSEAGLPRAAVRELEVEKDYERGVLVYEVEFEHGRTEYSYEIRVSDGKILTHSIEIDD